jgi:hypothetical protein
MISTVLSHTGALLKEKLFSRTRKDQVNLLVDSQEEDEEAGDLAEERSISKSLSEDGLNKRASKFGGKKLIMRGIKYLLCSV